MFVVPGQMFTNTRPPRGRYFSSYSRPRDQVGCDFISGASFNDGQRILIPCIVSSAYSSFYYLKTLLDIPKLKVSCSSHKFKININDTVSHCLRNGKKTFFIFICKHSILHNVFVYTSLQTSTTDLLTKIVAFSMVLIRVNEI